jgi:hypothetical protein
MKEEEETSLTMVSWDTLPRYDIDIEAKKEEEVVSNIHATQTIIDIVFFK